MKQLLFLLFISTLLYSCKGKSATDQSKTDTSAKLNYPFTARYSINWQKGDEKNALMVLNCLKKYVDGDIKGCVENFADTSEFLADQFYFKGSKDSLVKMLSGMRSAATSVTKEFESWMTTYYPDKKDTWVTLWYVERWTGKTGKKDSLYYTDDVLIKDGKIKLYDEKIRRGPARQTVKVIPVKNK